MKRYQLERSSIRHPCMGEHPTGMYVRWEDVAKLEAELDIYRRTYDGGGRESLETTLANERKSAAKVVASLEKKIAALEADNAKLLLHREAWRSTQIIQEATIETQNKYLDELDAKLPKTADEVPVVPEEDIVFAKTHRGVVACTRWRYAVTHWQVYSDQWVHVCHSFSTREAAEKS